MSEYTRNLDHHFWEQDQRHANCGSYALNVQVYHTKSQLSTVSLVRVDQVENCDF